MEAEKLSRDCESPLIQGVRVTHFSGTLPLRQTREVNLIKRESAQRVAVRILPILTREAASDPRCAAILSRFYFYGLGVEKDHAKAFSWALTGATKGNLSAMRYVAQAYIEGDGVAKDTKTGLRWITRAADRNDPGAFVALGTLSEDGNAIPKDDATVWKYYEKAAKAGSIEGMSSCGFMKLKESYNFDLGGVPGAVKELRTVSLGFLKQAAEAENSIAMIGIAEILRTGIPVIDPTEGFRWYEKAAASGSATALASLACCYLEGWGCPESFDKASTLLEKALVEAKNEGDERLSSGLPRLIGTRSHEGKREGLRQLLLWYELAGSKYDPRSFNFLPPAGSPMDAPPAMPPAKTSTKSRRTPRKTVPRLPAGTRLILQDARMTAPANVYLTVVGRIRNVSDTPLEFARVSVVYENRAGRLVSTGNAFCQPTTIPPGGIGTFETFDTLDPLISRFKLDFLDGAGKPILWFDATGMRIHQ